MCLFEKYDYIPRHHIVAIQWNLLKFIIPGQLVSYKKTDNNHNQTNHIFVK